MILFVLLWMVGLFGLGYYFGKKGGKQDENALVQRNWEWAQFIASYKKVAKTKDQKAVIKKMLDDIKAMGLPTVADAEVVDVQLSEEQRLATGQGVALQTNQQAISGEPAEGFICEIAPASNDENISDNEEETAGLAVDIDGPSLLLYFGAFLFIASAGLFVAFGGMTGTLKTMLVVLIVAVLYGTGLWLHKNNEKFSQVGVTFAGMGLAIAPLIGVTAYNYVFSSSNAQLVWFTTSIFCLAIYGHAMYVLQKPLLNYLFIFTILSLFESSASIIEAPIYIYGWILLVVGLLAQFIAQSSLGTPAFRDSSRVSSYLLTPLAILVSLALVPNEGLLQLSITLFIGALYYYLQSRYTDEPISQANNILTAHILSLVGIGTFAYALSSDWVITSGVLAVVNSMQVMLFVVLVRKPSHGSNNFAVTIIGAAILSLLISLHDPIMLLVSTGVVFVASIGVWLRTKEPISYTLALLSVPVAAVIYSLGVASPTFTNLQLAIAIFIAMVIQVILHVVIFKPNEIEQNYIAKILVITSGVAAVLASFGDSAMASLVIAVIVSLVNQLLAYKTKDDEFVEVNSVLSVLPLIRSYDGGAVLFYTALYALLLNITLAIRYRSEVFRWVGSFVWFVMPVALNTAFNFGWEAEAFTVAYFIITIGFLLARSIARGVLFMSSKIPLAAYDRNKSLSYVVGYGVSLVVMFIVSLWTQNSQLYTTIVLLVIMALLYVIATYIEKQRSIILLQPLLTQAFIVSLVRPDVTSTLINIYAIAATIAAAAWYWYVTDLMKDNDIQLYEYLRQISLGSAYVPALASLSVGVAAAMPISLAVAGVMTLHFAKSYSQASKEWSGVVIAIAAMWLLQYLGVSELQAYTHILALLFAIYAYLRHVREEYDASTSYIWATLAVATVPLALQALSAESGGLYGWWLLLEQVIFLLVGLSINNKIITFWGLYVAIATVLYQLRDLGWAALTILALTVIGIAIYQINKSGENK